MKKVYLLIISAVSGLLAVGQSHPTNVDIGLFAVGSNGSNTGLTAAVEVAIRIKPGGLSYTAIPVADDYGFYLVAPKTDFSTSDLVVLTEVNSALYGTTALTVMQEAGVYDLVGFDANNVYFPVVLNSGAGMNLSSLSAVTNAWSFTFTFKFNNAKTPAAISKLRIVDKTNNLAISNWNTAVNFGGPVFTNMQMGGQNQLTDAAFTVLPVSLLNFSGYKIGTKNVLKWATSSEENNVGFDVLRSTDGVNYSSIGFVNTQANGGNSSSELNYEFNDNSPAVSKRQYYRLNQKDIDGRARASNIVVIKGDKSTEFMIDGIFPNPASTTINVIINAPKRDDVTLLVTDALGKTVHQKIANVNMGSNTIPVDVAKLASGSYFVKVLCKSSDCETAIGKFNRQ